MVSNKLRPLTFVVSAYTLHGSLDFNSLDYYQSACIVWNYVVCVCIIHVCVHVHVCDGVP